MTRFATPDFQFSRFRCCILATAILLAALADAAGWKTTACETSCTARHEAAMTALNGRRYVAAGCAKHGGSPEIDSVEKKHLAVHGKKLAS